MSPAPLSLRLTHAAILGGMNQVIPSGKFFECVPTGESAGGSNLGASAVTATIDDNSFAYVAAVGTTGLAVVPRSNIPLGGSKLVSVTVTAKTKDTGVALPPVTQVFECQGAPIPPQATLLFLEGDALLDIAGAPADPGSASISIG